ncbi:hypothetical protein LTR56_014735 [Elasticomyces elasticus]|nr:hypothetical protein LTR56_014735 [Elasticomyces elasticus]KAK3645467.1 hypothetical protein LTR22_014729 [Elasticomyces elasticus]KAK4915823.1 hypothetical protein LTR49_016081 [Elasticomyces elasticus]KAK5755581.1 hypothetical protein LTS12_014337 [Elasticomyces elasticus]
MSWGNETTAAPAEETNGDSWGSDAAAETTENTDGATEGGEGETEAAAPQPPKPVLSKEEYIKNARNQGWNETTAFDYEQYNRTGGDNADWAGAGTKYEFKGEYGDVAPEVPELELLLFGGEFQMKKGEHYKNLPIDAAVEGPKKIDPIKSFDDAGLHPVVLDNVKRCGYAEPTPIQQYVVPAAMSGADVVAVSQTGSGKTAAYMIPVLSNLMGKAKKLCGPRPKYDDPSYNPKFSNVRAEPLVVIVVPTRELAMQIFDEARRMCYRSMLRPCVAYGGLPMGIMCDDLGKGCDILIATPGRLCHLMEKPDLLTMSRIKYTIIDEADEMLNQDWAEELQKIMAGGDSNDDADHTYMMFSATFPKEARKMARQYMADDHYLIRVGRAGQAHKNIRQEIIQVDRDSKRDAVYDLLMACDPGRTLIFCNSKPSVDLLDDFLYNRGLPTTSIHADRGQREREDALRAFRTGRCPILIATGVSARGWDVAGVQHVINYDLPSNMYGGIQEYVHRIGRTGRIGHQGLATSFYTDRDEELQQDLVNILVECECEVPEFLAHLKPEEGAAVDFDDDTDDEAEVEETAGEDGVAAPAAWGAETSAEEGADAGGFAADAGGFAADDGGFKADGAAAVSVGGW